MMINLLDQKIKEMKELRRLESIKANKVAQDAIDDKYRTILMQVNQTIEILEYTKKELNFTLSDTNHDKLSFLLEKLQEIVKSGFAVKDLVTDAEILFKNIFMGIKNDWSKHFIDITTATVSTLKVISAIDAEVVSICLTKIKSAETWSSNKLLYSNLRRSLDEATILIHNLNLDNEITEFLTEMNMGKANITHLNEKVLTWIRNENLETKIKLSFASKYN